MAVTYHVTGVDVYGRRFKIITTNRLHAFGINLFKGSVWEVKSDGSRKLLSRVWN